MGNKIKTMGNITPLRTTTPKMDRWEKPVLNLICHVNPDNDHLLPGFKVVLESICNNP